MCVLGFAWLAFLNVECAVAALQLDLGLRQACGAHQAFGWPRRIPAQALHTPY
jgi:hypothetical protein